MQRTTFKVLPSRKQVCRLALKNRLVVARGKPAIIVSEKQQVQFIQSNFFTNKPKVINFIHLFCDCEVCSGVKLLHRSLKDVNKCPNEL